MPDIIPDRDPTSDIEAQRFEEDPYDLAVTREVTSELTAFVRTIDFAEAFLRLDAKRQDLLNARVIDGKSYQKIADELNLRSENDPNHTHLTRENIMERVKDARKELQKNIASLSDPE